MNNLTRRSFLNGGAALLGGATLGVSLPAFSNRMLATEDYEIPGAPADNFVAVVRNIIPDRHSQRWQIKWQFAEDPYFEKVVNSDSVKYASEEDKLVQIRLENVPPNKKLYFKLECENCTASEWLGASELGKTTQFVVFPTTSLSASAEGEQRSPVVEVVY